MVTALLLILYFWGPQPFCPVGELVTTILLLGFVPVLAYPAQPLFPRYRSRGREGQRELAFVFTGVGYTIAFLWALLAGVSPEIRTICAGYFFSALFLTLCNRVLHRRAQRTRVQRGRAAFVPHLLLWLVAAAAQYCDRVAGGVGFGGT